MNIPDPCNNPSSALNLLRYKKLISAPFNFGAVFSDETDEYIEWNELAETVSVKLRLYKNQNCAVFFCLRTFSDAFDEIPMRKIWENGSFDYYTISFEVKSSASYFFKISNVNGDVFYYNKRGVYPDLDLNYNFRLIPGFKSPDWVKGAVMYQIYTDRFFNGDKSNDVVNNEYAYLGRAAKCIDNWKEPVGSDDICNFYGGDLAGIMQKIPYLRELGVEAIYLNPIFVSPSNHKYDIQDYDYVDPHYGRIVNDGGEPLYFERFKNLYATKYMKRTTDIENLEKSNELFAELVETAHKNGIKVILDGVFNHCGAFNKWLDAEGFYERNGYPPGAFRDRHSPYANYFRWNNESWPNNEYYDCWWGHQNHPKLNFEGSPELYEYIMHIAKKWVSPPFNADGWRLDVAADLGYSKEFNHKFYQDFRRAVKSANPEAVIIAEHYGDPSDWLSGGEWDTVMNYDAFMEPVTWFFCGMEKHSQEFKPEMLNDAHAFERAMRYHMSRLPAEALHTAMNQLSNHDHSRFLTRTNLTPGRLHTLGAKAAERGINKSVMCAATVVLMTWPGAPCVYYGDEAGLCGWTDPDNRRPFPWGFEDEKLLAFHKELIRLRKNSAALRKGSLEYLLLEPGVLCYARTYYEEKTVVLVNNNSTDKEIRVPVWKLDPRPESCFVKLIETTDGSYSLEAETLTARGNILRITAPPLSGMVFRLSSLI